MIGGSIKIEEHGLVFYVAINSGGIIIFLKATYYT
jgi:hypothetical protein